MALGEADPRQLGAFRLVERRRVCAEGVVYAGRDGSGRAVSVALLSAGASADAAARDRFVAAVSKGAGVEGPVPPVLGWGVSAAAAWAAVADEGAGAGVFLAPVAAGGPRGGTGPGYVPYWATSGGASAPRWAWSGRGGGGVAAPGRSSRGLVAGLAVLVALLVALLVVLYFFLSGLRQEAYSTPAEVPSPGGGAQESPGTPSVSPSPQESDQGGESQSPAPVPSVELGEDEVEQMPEAPRSPQDYL
ncbi:hypothetical protein [Nocardiopsis ansamitocini]|nr:hypothetical protein [Nocardiopsis ansamitocini]